MPRRYALAIAATLTAAVAVTLIAASPPGSGGHGAAPAAQSTVRELIEYVQATPADGQGASAGAGQTWQSNDDSEQDDEGVEFGDDDEHGYDHHGDGEESEDGGEHDD